MYTDDAHNPDLPDDVLPDEVQTAVMHIRSEPVPQQALSRSLDRARQLNPTACTVPARSIRRRLWQRAAIGAGVAACVLAVALLWPTRATVAWAQVAAAVQGRPWIHVQEKYGDRTTAEGWVSATHRISASRRGERVDFHDGKLNLQMEYNPDEGVLIRLPEERLRGKDPLQMLVETCAALFAADAPVNAQLDDLTFIDDDRSGLELIDTDRQRVTADGREWVDFSLTLRYRNLAEPVAMTVRVDASTHLPQSWVTTGTVQGQKVRREMLLDYPEQGPADVFALGVPRTAKLVDRVPSGDLARLLAGVQAARQRFDSYHAIVVESTSLDDSPAAGSPIQIWRKGNRWRVEYAAEQPTFRAAAGVDWNAWWRERVREVTFYPVMNCDGAQIHDFEIKFVEAEPPARRGYFMQKVRKRPIVGQADDPFPVFWAMMPEYISHPPMGVPRAEMEPTIDLTPSDGPAGTVLLQVCRKGTKAAPPNDLPAQPDEHRYWIDPSKNFVVMRWGDGGAPLSGGMVIEKLAQSPSGQWYPTEVRIKDAIRSQTGEVIGDQLYRFYLDFAADLPDSLFSSGE